MRHVEIPALLTLITVLDAQDAIETRVFVEMDTAKPEYFAQEIIRLRLRFGIDTEFATDNLIQLFRKNLDIPVRVEAPWLEELPGAVFLPVQESPDTDSQTFVLNDDDVVGTHLEDRQVDGRRFTVVEIERRFLAESPGALELPAPTMQFAYATGFREDFLQGRVPVDRNDGSVTGIDRSVRIKPLPEEGRPPGFTGAVGRFTVDAEGTAEPVTAGESTKLVIHIEGRGNLGLFAAPSLEEAPGFEAFHVYGRIEGGDGTRRTITYDLAPLSEAVRELPAIQFSFFDPGDPAGYRTVQTDPVPLEVTPRPADAGPIELPTPAARPESGVDDIFGIRHLATPTTDAAGHRMSSAVLILTLLAPWLGLLGFVSWHRVLARRRMDPAHRRAAGAATAFRAQMDAPKSDLVMVFAEFLAARLHCPIASVIAPELPARLAAAGVPPETARRTATLLEILVDERFAPDIASSQSAEERMEANTLVNLLEAVFEASQNGKGIR